MMVEFEKRIFHLNQEISALKSSGHNASEQVARLEGALEEAERLYGFYKNQMMVQGGGHEKNASANANNAPDADNSGQG
ncbi:MAG: hypothetical protein A2048_01315 [Deltaproteobacteria bacterium GWA2_45_12]|nr:MAG: hypothetical protein A2048_01315 [Deltaproteobacteria bacterium GWA2_45_12]